MKRISARSANRVMKRANAFYLTIFVLASFTACASISTREAAPEIRISPEVMGAGLELNPLLLRVEPGQKVTWTNQTTYEIQINFESDPPVEGHPSLIRPFSAVGGSFDREGTYSYTLVYSSSETFGRVTGTIVVGNPRQKERSLPRRPKEFLPPEETPDTLPDII
jgi:plastocyanin